MDWTALVRTWPARVVGRLPWPRRGSAQALTAVLPGARWCVVRLEAGGADGRIRLAAAREGPPDQLAAWRAQGLFNGAQALLVLPRGERHLAVIDRPEVDDAELAAATRWPLAEAMDAEPDALLTTAVALPRINDASRPQVLGVAARLDAVRAHLRTCDAAGIKITSVDVIDSALRGMVMLQPSTSDGWVSLAYIGDDVGLALVWQGRFCGVRTLAMPATAARGDLAFVDQLALQIQRTVDQYERQANQFALRQVLVSLPSMPVESREALRASLTMSAGFLALDEVMDVPDAADAMRCRADDDLCALAGVAAARWLDARGAAAPLERAA